MNIIAISDTHNQLDYIYDDLLIYKGYDILIHAGDGANSKHFALNQPQMEHCLHSLNSLHDIFKCIIYVPGNHDTSIEAGMVDLSKYKNVNVLIHNSMKYKHVSIFGSPYTPSFGTGWAYNVPRHKIANYWDKIPDDTDILITHGPPKGISDLTGGQGMRRYEQAGCKSLLNAVHKINPTLHIFGHIHDEKDVFNYGKKRLWNTTFVNASIVDLNHNVVNKPVEISAIFGLPQYDKK